MKQICNFCEKEITLHANFIDVDRTHIIGACDEHHNLAIARQDMVSRNAEFRDMMRFYAKKWHNQSITTIMVA